MGVNMEEILQNWNLKGLCAKPLSDSHKSTWDIDGKYVLKCNPNAEELLSSVKLSQLLADEGIKVATYISTKDGCLTTANGQYGLMNKLTGNYIELYERPTLAYELGKEIAYLHTALSRIEPNIQCNDNDLSAEWLNIINPTIADSIAKGLFNRIKSLFIDEYPNLPRQLIHRDLHVRNFLYDNERLSGWFDFDNHLRDIRIFDLATLLYYHEHDIIRIETYLQIVSSLLEGYNEVSILSIEEYGMTPFLVIAMKLVFLSLFPKEENPKMFYKELEWTRCLYEVIYSY
jgi:Ser/Thr protein kinase RdoA (MazF antagonist)